MFNQVEPALSIRVNMLSDGTLTPDPIGIGVATVCFTRDESGFKTGLLQFAGLNQASLNYDQTQSMIVGYGIMNHAASLADQQSIERLIHYINANSHNALVVSI
jgi:hypothetical protein